MLLTFKTREESPSIFFFGGGVKILNFLYIISGTSYLKNLSRCVYISTNGCLNGKKEIIKANENNR